jgi:hypothetical protein
MAAQAPNFNLIWPTWDVDSQAIGIQARAPRCAVRPLVIGRKSSVSRKTRNAGCGPGWRASQKGEQQIRIIFDKPMSLHRIQLRFHEAESERKQEYIVRWSSAAGGPEKEIVRQQWNFSPAGSTTEIEDYAVDLDGVSVLELAIQPDVGRRDAVATLAVCRLR